MSITDELREWAKKLTHWWYDPEPDRPTHALEDGDSRPDNHREVGA